MYIKKLRELLSRCLLIGTVLLAGSSCGDWFSEDYDVNEWILQNMQIYYYWNNYIPTSTNTSLSPSPYFYSLLYTPEDRFSWIQENYLELLEQLSGIDTEAGYDFVLSYYDTTVTPATVCGIINYIKKNSPAEDAGLKRGHIFTEINGQELNETNYSSLIEEIYSPHSLKIRDLTTETYKTVSLSVLKYQENPVLLDTIYNLPSKKIGYLVYNFFADDAGDGSNKYAIELNNIFGRFINQGIDELILDFRYNSGGSLSTATLLSSMVSGKGEKDLFLYYDFNQIVTAEYQRMYGNDFNKVYFADYIGNSLKINKLSNLTRLFVITGNRTASASETVINGLNPFIDITLVGNTTYGKNVGSYTIYEEDPTKRKYNKWGMQPIVVKLANANYFSDFGNGFTPNLKINEYKNENMPLKPLGDINETLLRATLEQAGIDASTFAEPTQTLRSSTEIINSTPITSSADRRPARRTTNIKKL